MINDVTADMANDMESGADMALTCQWHGTDVANDMAADVASYMAADVAANMADDVAF